MQRWLVQQVTEFDAGRGRNFLRLYLPLKLNTICQRPREYGHVLTLLLTLGNKEYWFGRVRIRNKYIACLSTDCTDVFAEALCGIAGKDVLGRPHVYLLTVQDEKNG